MTVHVDPRAIVHPTAKLAEGVTIGPFAIIGEEVSYRGGDLHCGARGH